MKNLKIFLSGLFVFITIVIFGQIWPVDNPPACRGSYSTCNNFPDEQGTIHQEQHAAIDIPGTPNIDYVLAVNSGVIGLVQQQYESITITLYVESDLNNQRIYAHCEQYENGLVLYTGSYGSGFIQLPDGPISVTITDYIATIADHSNALTNFDHAHFAVNINGVVKDPLSSDYLNTHDPLNSDPICGPLFLVKENDVDYFDFTLEPACYNKVKIIKEIYDHMETPIHYMIYSDVFPPTSELAWNGINDRYNGITGAPNKIRYWIENINGIKVYPINNNNEGEIDFSGPPKTNSEMEMLLDHWIATYSDDQLINRRYYCYLLTNVGNNISDPESIELVDDGTWNTKLKSGEAWNSSIDAVNPELGEGQFPDGKYYLNVLASDIVNIPTVPNEDEIIVNNFRPFIKKVEIIQDWTYNTITIPMTIYSAEWTWNGSNYQLLENEIESRYAKLEGDLTITITASESMDDISLKIETLSNEEFLATSISDDSKEWEFLVPESSLIGVHMLNITAVDMAGYSIEEFQYTHNTYSVPSRNLAGDWSAPQIVNPNGVELGDTKHAFEISPTFIAFIASDQVLVPDEIVTFTNLSAGYDDSYIWEWHFFYKDALGSNLYELSNLRDPLPFKYPDDAVYDGLLHDVELKVRDSDYQPVDILVYPEFILLADENYLEAEFDAEINGYKGQLFGNSPLTINFTDISTGTPTSWDWDFGEIFATSTWQNPTYTYTNNGSEPVSYTITLQVENGNGGVDEIIKESLVTVYPEGVPLTPYANFTISQSSLYAPSYVNFANTSTGNITEYNWDLNGDGYFDYFLQDPPLQQIYNENTNVTLEVSNGVDPPHEITKTINVYINSGSGVIVDFHWEPDPIKEGDFVSFDDDITNFYYPYYCVWKFTDPQGLEWEKDFVNDPTEIFTYVGLYNVILEIYDWDNNFLGVCQKDVEVLPPTIIEYLPNQKPPPGILGYAYGKSATIDNNFAAVGGPYLGGKGIVVVYAYDEIVDDWAFQEILSGSDSEDNDRFGWAVDISGDYMIIGAPHDNYLQDPTGSAYVYKLIDGSWEEDQKLVPSDAMLNDYIGHHVAIDGNFIVLGDWNNNSSTHPGKAYVYQLIDDEWIEIDKLFGENGFVGDGFGEDVAISGDRIAIGSNENSDKAYIFERQSNDDWIETACISVSGLGEVRVALSGNTLMASKSRYENGSNFWVKGWVFMYECINGEWVNQGQLVNNACSEANFGSSISINGDYAIVGAHGDNVNGERSGSVFSYIRDSYGNWNFFEKIVPSNGQQLYLYGHSVSLGDRHLIVGQPGEYVSGTHGSVYLYNNYISVCDRMISEIDYNLEPGAYPDLRAGDITLGGNPPNQVVFQSGVYKHYYGGVIRLLEGFIATNGCSFGAKAIDCSETLSKENGLIPKTPTTIELENLNFEVMDFNEHNGVEKVIKVFPNPTKQKLFVKLQNISGDVSFELKDLYGNVVTKDNFEANSNLTIDIGHLPKGIFILWIKTEEMEFLEKIIHQ